MTGDAKGALASMRIGVVLLAALADGAGLDQNRDRPTAECAVGWPRSPRHWHADPLLAQGRIPFRGKRSVASARVEFRIDTGAMPSAVLRRRNFKKFSMTDASTLLGPGNKS